MYIQNIMSKGIAVQKLLDALQVLDEKTYNQILDDGVCFCYGQNFKVDKYGKVAW
jgi:hypothetical protein